MCYSPDGKILLGVGHSKFICAYDLSHKVLLYRYNFTENRSLSGVLNKLNSKLDPAADPSSEVSTQVYEIWEDLNEQGIPEPHRPGDLSRKVIREVRANKIAYSPNGRTFAVVTTEGLLEYSMDE